jgi:uncharacterized protein
MAVDHIRYDILAQEALRGVVRTVLSDAAKDGLPGEHHFYITFDTRADGVRLSQRMLGQYPERMTVVLQHQFWDLIVTEEGFEVGLSFGGVPERLAVPFAAIKEFIDPSVEFGLRFEEVGDAAEAPAGESANSGQGAQANLNPAAGSAPARAPERPPAEHKGARAPAAATPTASGPEQTEPRPDKPSGGGEVVRLDRFRKKQD